MQSLSFNRRHFSALALASMAAAVMPLPAAAQTRPTVLVLGDSLSAEYGIERGTGWVALLDKQLAKDKLNWQVVNASISGDTTAGGRARLGAALTQHQPKVVVIELGGNDALRGLPIEHTAANLKAMTNAAQAAGARVLIVGMQVPPNFGADYAKRFADVFAQVAKTEKAALVPFMLKGVADAVMPLRYFQADRIHPKAEAHPIILGNIYPELKKLLLAAAK